MRSIGAAAIAALIAVGLVSAQAADLPDKRILKAPPPPPLYGGVWIAAEYLIWSAKGDKLPALVTTSPAGTLQPQAGVLGAPGTSVLFGDDNVNDRWRSGARISAGYWFDPQRTKGIEANFFILHQNSTDFAASSNGTPILARPFIDATTGLQSAKLLAFPAFVSGSIAISDASRLLGAGAAYRMEICRNCALGSIGGLVGYRFLRLRDSLVIGDTSVSPLGAITSTDQFDTTNSFHGLDLGLTGEIATGPWRMTWLAKLAVGRTLTNVEISGATVGDATGVGGLYALPTNIGSHDTGRFAVVPELAANVSYQISSNLRAFAGYTVLYWSGLVRPGGTIDSTINPNLLPPPTGLGGPARPQAQFNTTDYWAQGFNVGLAYSY